MRNLGENINSHLYERVAGELASLIESGTFRPGDRVPSVRERAEQRGVSVTTILQAYRLLETQGYIEARPQSGYYVRERYSTGLPEPELDAASASPERVSVESLALMIMRDMVNPRLVQFGAAIPDPALLPTARLNRSLAIVARSEDIPSNISGAPQGQEELRAQIARRAVNSGCHLSPDDLVITAGCMEAFGLCLRTVCKPGDTVVVESPTFFGILQALESQGLRALEIPTHPVTGISLDALRFAIEHQNISACLLTPNFSNPLGSCMPDENKAALVEMLAEFNIPLIEDDIQGELYFGDVRPNACKAYDRKGMVMLCSSFSKDLAPGYRIGWVAAGRYRSDVEQLKMATNGGTAVLPQLAIAHFLATGGYEHTLRRIRQAYMQKVNGMAQAILRYFPQGARVSSPSGGHVVWVQLPDGVDSLDLYRMALKDGITLAPGHIFSATSRYANYFRLNAAYYSDSTDWAVRRLGELVGVLMEMDTYGYASGR